MELPPSRGIILYIVAAGERPVGAGGYDMHRVLRVALCGAALSLLAGAGCQKVTKAQCDQVKKGMDIIQVARALGNRGEEKPTGSTAGPEVVQRTWSNADGTSCNVLFRRGKVYQTLWSK
jgi:hypothetical protein